VAEAYGPDAAADLEPLLRAAPVREKA
jgi:hypothetical protein